MLLLTWCDWKFSQRRWFFIMINHWSYIVMIWKWRILQRIMFNMKELNILKSIVILFARKLSQKRFNSRSSYWRSKAITKGFPKPGIANAYAPAWGEVLEVISRMLKLVSRSYVIFIFRGLIYKYRKL